MTWLVDGFRGMLGALGVLALALIGAALTYAVARLLARGRVVAGLLVVAAGIVALTPIGTWLVWGVCSVVLAIQTFSYALFTVRGLMAPKNSRQCNEAWRAP